MENKELLDMAKKRGLDIAEESAGALGQLALDIVGHYANQNKYAKMLWAGVEDDVRKGLANLVDKIDGEVDAK
jgi:hypothetical protein